MRRSYSVVLYFVSLLLMTSCSTIRTDTHSANIDAAILPIAIPLQISYQDEVNLLRLNKLLSEQQKFTSSDRARLLYERGLIYDRMGLAAHSRYDLNQAINIDPTFAPAYNIVGLYLLLSRSYDQAFDAFDSALELDKGMEYSYLHMAIGLYQVQRYALASDNINTFYHLNSDDPYRILWRYIINSKIDKKKALFNLQHAVQKKSDVHFAWDLVDIIAGRMSERQFFEQVSEGVTTNKELAQRLCEAYFYLGHWHEIAGNVNQAIHYYKLVLASNIHDFIEYKYALIELSSIQTKLGATPATAIIK